MLQHAYPERETHRKEHEAFIHRIHSLQQSAVQPTTRVGLDVAAFCKDWWQKHILGMDRKVGAFLNDKGVT